MDFEKISDKILKLDDAMRYVRFLGNEGELIHHKVNRNKILLQDEKGLGALSAELPIMKKIQSLFDESLGKNTFMHIIREKVHQFVYYVDSLIIYVTCERNTDPHRVTEIVNNIDSILKEQS
jgi:hypothetical protein